jgi:glycosyltransferase involved in cell wall biosynthesis
MPSGRKPGGSSSPIAPTSSGPHAVNRPPSRGPVTGAPRRRRVLVLIKGLEHGGAERLLVDVVAHRDKEKFDYEVAYVLASLDALAPSLEADHVTVHALGATGNSDVRWMGSLRRLLMAGDYDIVHFHMPYASALGRLVVLTMPRRRRPRLVQTEHISWDIVALPFRALNRSLMGRRPRLIVISRQVADALPDRLRRRATVVVHGVDLAQAADLRSRRQALRDEVRSELGVADDEILALTVANLRAQKGYEILLESARRVTADGARVRFAAVGTGEQSAEIHALHHSLGLGDRFQLLGERSDVGRLLAGADMFVMASHFEGLPVAIMEATSMGLPIVTTAVGEIPNVLTDGVDALLVPPGRVDALTAAIERLAADPSLRSRLGTAALERSAMFDIARATTQIEGIYGDLVEGVD